MTATCPIDVRFIESNFMKAQRMIHCLLVLGVLMASLCSTWARADRPADTPVTFCVEAGAVLARYTHEIEPPHYEFPFRLGGYIGIAVRISVTDILAFQPGLAYERKGAKVDGSFPVADATGNVIGRGTYVGTDRVDYLSLPLTLEASFRRPTISPYFRAGPEVSFLVSGRRHSVLDVAGDRGVEDEDIEDEFKGADIGILMGAGVMFTGSLPVYFEVRYVHGITDITEGPSDQSNRAFVGAIGVRL